MTEDTPKVEKEEKKVRPKKTKDAPKEEHTHNQEKKEVHHETPKHETHHETHTGVPHTKPAESKVAEEKAPKVVKPVSSEAKAKKVRKKKVVAAVARGKRKESVARAHVLKGNGTIRINHRSLVAYATNKYVRDIIREPLRYLGPEALALDVHVNVFGGGVLGQAQASRTAIARALVNHFPDQNLKDTFLSIDKSLLIEDVRRVEPKKFKGPKARARFQKSYR